MTSETSELFAKQLPVDELDDLRGLGRRAPRRGGYGGALLRNDLNQPKFLTFQSSFGSTALATPSTVKSLPNRTTGWAVSA